MPVAPGPTLSRLLALVLLVLCAPRVEAAPADPSPAGLRPQRQLPEGLACGDGGRVHLVRVSRYRVTHSARSRCMEPVPHGRAWGEYEASARDSI